MHFQLYVWHLTSDSFYKNQNTNTSVWFLLLFNICTQFSQFSHPWVLTVFLAINFNPSSVLTLLLWSSLTWQYEPVTWHPWCLHPSDDESKKRTLVSSVAHMSVCVCVCVCVWCMHNHVTYIKASHLKFSAQVICMEWIHLEIINTVSGLDQGIPN